MTQVCDDAILQCYRELALTLRRTLKSACHCFDARRPHFRKSTVCGEILFSVLSMVCRSADLHCGYVLTHFRSVWAPKIFAFINSFLYSVIVIWSSCKFCGISVSFSWCWRAAKIGKTCQWQLSPEIIPFLHLALFLLLQFRCIGYILSLLNISQNTAFLESRSVPWETVRQILCNYLHGLIDF